MPLIIGAVKAILVFLVAAVLVSCTDGGGYGDQGGGQPPPSTGDAAWDRVAPVIAANCGGCHAAGNARGLPTFGSAAAFKGSKAKARLTAGTMPPAPKTISDGDKAALLSYLGG